MRISLSFLSVALQEIYDFLGIGRDHCWLIILEGFV